MDITEIVFKLALILLLVALNGFFVAAEFAIVKMRLSRLDAMINSGIRLCQNTGGACGCIFVRDSAGYNLGFFGPWLVGGAHREQNSDAYL